MISLAHLPLKSRIGKEQEKVEFKTWPDVCYFTAWWADMRRKVKTCSCYPVHAWYWITQLDDPDMGLEQVLAMPDYFPTLNVKIADEVNSKSTGSEFGLAMANLETTLVIEERRCMGGLELLFRMKRWFAVHAQNGGYISMTALKNIRMQKWDLQGYCNAFEALLYQLIDNPRHSSNGRDFLLKTFHTEVHSHKLLKTDMEIYEEAEVGDPMKSYAWLMYRCRTRLQRQRDVDQSEKWDKQVASGVIPGVTTTSDGPKGPKIKATPAAKAAAKEAKTAKSDAEAARKERDEAQKQAEHYKAMAATAKGGGKDKGGSGRGKGDGKGKSKSEVPAHFKDIPYGACRGHCMGKCEFGGPAPGGWCKFVHDDDAKKKFQKDYPQHCHKKAAPAAKAAADGKKKAPTVEEIKAKQKPGGLCNFWYYFGKCRDHEKDDSCPCVHKPENKGKFKKAPDSAGGKAGGAGAKGGKGKGKGKTKSEQPTGNKATKKAMAAVEQTKEESKAASRKASEAQKKLVEVRGFCARVTGEVGLSYEFDDDNESHGSA